MHATLIYQSISVNQSMWDVLEWSWRWCTCWVGRCLLSRVSLGFHYLHTTVNIVRNDHGISYDLDDFVKCNMSICSMYTEMTSWHSRSSNSWSARRYTGVHEQLNGLTHTHRAMCPSHRQCDSV